jgi:anti-repressor protein
MTNLNVEIKESKDLGLVVSSRTVAEQLGKEHKHVKETLNNMIEMSRDFDLSIIKSEYKDNMNRTQTEYLLTKKGFNLYMFNIQGYLEYKMAYINEFERMEQALKAQPQLTTDSYMIEDPLERAKAWIKEEEQRQQLQMTVTELAPKAEFADAVSESVNTISIGFLAKLLKKNGVDTGRTKLFAWLRSNGYLIKSGKDKNTPTQRALDLGIFDVKETVVINKWGNSVTSKTTSVTGKGQTYFIKKFLGTKEIALAE